MTASPGTGVAADWFVRLPGGEPGGVQVFAFPHAGAGCAAFGECTAELSGVLDVWTANLPGRQARFLEPCRTEIQPLVAELADALPSYRDGRPYGIVGYCAGALLAYLLTAELQRRGAEPPARLVLVSYATPGRVPADPDLHTLPSARFWERISALGGVHERLAAHPDARQVFEPALRGDFTLLAGYRPAADEPVLGAPISVVAGRDDPLLDVAELTRWRDRTAGDFRLHLIRGGHWLLEDEPAGLAAALAEQLAGAARGR
ncbi:thioesterase II family protein [Kutzneria kofuensis]|uniref:Surfactin synthase thioesterase subunit n=1 Tax=Kutzneria kofuensis TaxID=103725 RepID=A0A7W9KT03_9PSEU|nr:thioesterase domain-containing protein [Kutzneria kofuensis]MBB5898135.1 surfactin synthase thioesterase subunit [Kutzneria kofuensis]